MIFLTLEVIITLFVFCRVQRIPFVGWLGSSFLLGSFLQLIFLLQTSVIILQGFDLLKFFSPMILKIQTRPSSFLRFFLVQLFHPEPIGASSLVQR